MKISFLFLYVKTKPAIYVKTYFAFKFPLKFCWGNESFKNGWNILMLVVFECMSECLRYNHSSTRSPRHSMFVYQRFFFCVFKLVIAPKEASLFAFLWQNLKEFFSYFRESLMEDKMNSIVIIRSGLETKNLKRIKIHFHKKQDEL